MQHSHHVHEGVHADMKPDVRAGCITRQCEAGDVVSEGQVWVRGAKVGDDLHGAFIMAAIRQSVRLGECIFEDFCFAARPAGEAAQMAGQTVGVTCGKVVWVSGCCVGRVDRCSLLRENQGCIYLQVGLVMETNGSRQQST